MALFQNIKNAYQSATKALQSFGANVVGPAIAKVGAQPAAVGMAKWPQSNVPTVSPSAATAAKVAKDVNTITNIYPTNTVPPVGFSPLQGGDIAKAQNTNNNPLATGAPSFMNYSSVSAPTTLTSGNIATNQAISGATPSYLTASGGSSGTYGSSGGIGGNGALAGALAGARTGTQTTPYGQSGLPTEYGQQYVDTQGNVQTAKFDPMTGQPLKDKNQYDAQTIMDKLDSWWNDKVGKTPDTASIYRQVEQDAQLQQKQQIVNDLTAQLNTIEKQAQADQLSLVGQGRGIPEAIIGGQQAQIAREAAIKALPVSAQLAAAQGNLQLAQQHVDTYAKLLIQDAREEYQQKVDMFKTIAPYLDKTEQRRLDVIDAKTKLDSQMKMEIIKARADAIKAMVGRATQAEINLVQNSNSLEEIAAYSGGYTQTTKSEAQQQYAVGSAAQQLNAARGADGYTDPNLYARVRAQSSISAPEFDNRFGYLVNPLSAARLGIATASSGSDVPLTPTQKQSLVGAGIPLSEIPNVQSFVNQYGLQSFFDNNPNLTDTQKSALSYAYGL